MSWKAPQCNIVHNVMEDLIIPILRPSKERKFDHAVTHLLRLVPFVTRILDTFMSIYVGIHSVEIPYLPTTHLQLQSSHKTSTVSYWQMLCKQYRQDSHPSIIPTSESPSYQNIRSFSPQQQPHTPSPSPLTCIQSPTYPTLAHHTVNPMSTM